MCLGAWRRLFQKLALSQTQPGDVSLLGKSKEFLDALCDTLAVVARRSSEDKVAETANCDAE